MLRVEAPLFAEQEVPPFAEQGVAPAKIQTPVDAAKPGDFRREQARPVSSARSVLLYASTLDTGIAQLSTKSTRFR